MGLFDIAKELDVKHDFDLWRNYNPTWYQLEYHNSPAQYRVGAIGRRGGKSEMVVRDCSKKCWRDGGERQIIAPTWKQCEPTFNKLYKTIKAVKDKVVYRMTMRPPYRVEFKNGGTILWGSADDPHTIRGDGPLEYYLDEYAFMRDPEQVWDTILPACMDHNAPVTVISTPWGQNNLFYDFWKRGMSKAEKWKAWQAWGYRPGEPDCLGFTCNTDRGLPSYENPFLQKSPEQLKDEFTSDMAYEREILCYFHATTDRALHVPDSTWGSSMWLDSPILGANKIAPLHFMGIDLGKHEDWTVVTVMDQNYNVVHVYRWQLNWKVTIDRIENMLKLWNGQGLIDVTGVGDPVFDELVSRKCANIQPYSIYSNQEKAALIERLQMGFDYGMIKLPELGKHTDTIDVMKRELDRFSYKMMNSGMIQYSAPDREHDDCVLSLALAFWMAYSGKNIVGMGKDWDNAWANVI